MKLNTIKKIILCIILTISSFFVNAGFILNPATCNVNNASLTNMQAIVVDPSSSSGMPSGTNLLSTSYNATACVGVYSGNDAAGGLSSPSPNIGQAGDGLLNGEDILNGQEFVSVSEFQALDGDGIKDDPGWIHLSHFSSENNAAGNVTYSSIGPSPINPTVMPIAIDDLLTFSLTCNSAGGSLTDCSSIDWLITTKLNIIDDVQELLGPSTFDHLAIVVKAGSGQSGDGFSVYDFNFNTIFASENNPLLNFNTPYQLGGTLNTADLGGKGISHINVWARDPIDDLTTVSVPEPSTIALFSMVISFFTFRQKRC